MVAINRTFGIRVVEPGEPFVRQWFDTPFMLESAQLGQTLARSRDLGEIDGFAVVLTDEREEAVGVVLFERLASQGAAIHLGLRTMGQRSDEAFWQAIEVARDMGVRYFAFRFARENRAALAFAQRNNLLTEHETQRPEWATCDWVAGKF